MLFIWIFNLINVEPKYQETLIAVLVIVLLQILCKFSCRMAAH